LMRREKPERLRALSRDVTAQKLTGDTLREAHLQVARSDERWRAVFENSAIAIALADIDGQFFAANPVFQKMVGYSEEELRALSYLDIIPEDYREASRKLATELQFGQQRKIQLEKQYRRKNGSSPGHASETITDLAGTGIRASRQQPDLKGKCSHHRRQQPRPGEGRSGRPFPG
jgi:PAS domain S-box-containing protein